MKSIFCFILIMSMVFCVQAQSKTINDFEKNTDGYKLFLYQSLIRVFNKDNNPEFNMLIRDLDHLRIILSDSTGNAAVNVFKQVDSGIRDEGFEEIALVDNKAYKYHVYELKSKRGKSSWVATMLIEGRAGIIEMRGSLNLKFLNALTSLSWEELKDILPGQVMDLQNGKEKEIIIE